MRQYDPLRKRNVKLYTPIKTIKLQYCLNTVKYSYGFFTLQKPRNLWLLHPVIQWKQKRRTRLHC